MMNTRELFLSHLAQTSPTPIGLEIVRAKGTYLWDKSGKKYLDLIAGISVCNVGHCHPRIIKAIHRQSSRYLHLLVYGELIESPQVRYAQLLCRHLPSSLNSVYFTNSGAEATEGAMKLAKRATGRTRILAFTNSYHGSTQGALSIIGDEYWRNAYRPLLPDIYHLPYNSMEALDEINSGTACVIAETIQAEAGVIVPDKAWMQAMRNKCHETGALLVFDAIQTGFGRTGTLWGFESFEVVPDILLLGKALGGGLPLGAFVADRSLMQCLSARPVLGHITTFGGHPLSCAAGNAALKWMLKERLVEQVRKKEALFRALLDLPPRISIRSQGLLMALDCRDSNMVTRIVREGINKGVLTDWFLFEPGCLRLAPPLTISEKQIRKASMVLSRIIYSLQAV